MAQPKKKTLSTKPSVAIQRLRIAMEVLWLATAFFVPLIVASPDWMLSFIELPKLAALRILTGLLAMLWVVEWAISDENASGEPKQLNWRSMLIWLKASPSHWILGAVIVFIAVNAVSTLLSLSVGVSVWGANVVEDGYSLYNTASYAVLFLVVAAHLQTRKQLWRLVYAVIAASVAASLIGFAEHFDIIQVGGIPDESVKDRVDSTFGNPIFFGAFLVMAIPLSIGAFIVRSKRAFIPREFAIWSVVIGVQLAALLLTLSRGPWLGLISGLAIFFALAPWFIGRRTTAKSAGVLVTALLLAFVVIQLPAPDKTNASANSVSVPGDSSPQASIGAELVTERATSVYSDFVSASLTGRANIWQSSANLIIERPQIPDSDDKLSPLRHLVGYGPDLFGFVYPLEAPTKELFLKQISSFAHNHVIHTWVELGLLGLLSYLALWGLLFGGMLTLLLKKRRRLTLEHRVIVLALLAALGGRFVEQMAGIAHVGDLTVFWLLLAVWAALPRAMSKPVNAARQIEKRKSNSQTFGAKLTWRYGTAVVVVILLGVLIWSRSITYLQADAAAASGDQLAELDAPKALEHIDDAIAFAPDAAHYYDLRGQILQNLQNANNDPAVQLAFTEEMYANRLFAEETRPLEFPIRLRTANAAMRLARLGYEGMSSEAIQRYESLAEFAPNSTEVRTLLAIAYIEEGRFRDGVEVLKEARGLRLDRLEVPTVNYLQGVASHELGETSDAIELLENAFFGYGGNIPVRDSAMELLAEIYEDLGDPTRREYYASFIPK